MPVTVNGTNLNALELPETPEFGEGKLPEITGSGLVGAVESATPTIHGVAHTIARYRVTLKTAVQTNKPITMIQQAHAGSLMDPVPHSGEVGTVEKKLDPTQVPLPKIRTEKK